MKIQTIKKGKHFVRFWDRFWLPNTTKSEERVHIRMSGPGMRYDYGDAFELDFYDLKNSDNIRSDSVKFEQVGALHTVSNAYFGGNKTAKGRIKFEVMIF
jgi:hypothetical protein